MSGAGQLVRKDDPSVEIIGTADVIPGVARVTEASLVSGRLHCVYAGTDVDWDGQLARRTGRWRLFVDENGELVSEADVALKLDDGSLQSPAEPGEDG